MSTRRCGPCVEDSRGLDVLQLRDLEVADVEKGKNGRDSETFDPQSQPKH